MISIGRSPTSADLSAAWQTLCDWFLPYDRVSVLVSGGVDSSLLLAAAVARSDTMDVTAVTADSPSIARSEIEHVRAFVAALGVPHLILETDELDDSSYRANLGNRCYFCKKALYRALERTLAEVQTMSSAGIVVDGTNADDLSDHRPSLPASREHGLKHPFVELGFGKQIIRELSRARGLDIWNKPAMACLASRIQDGIEVSREKLLLVESAEAILTRLGFSAVRVRYHESGCSEFQHKIARIEVNPSDIPLLAADDVRQKVATQIKALGFTHVTMDLEGYKRGGRPRQ